MNMQSTFVSLPHVQTRMRKPVRITSLSVREDEEAMMSFYTLNNPVHHVVAKIHL